MNSLENRIEKIYYIPLVVYTLAFIVRFIFLLETANDPFFNVLLGDPLFYDNWAMKIMGGSLLGEGIWEMSPLYPYLLALVYTITGHNYLVIRFLHVIMGSATCLLVYFTGKKLFSKTVGLTAALLAVFTGPLIFFDGIVMKTSLGVFLATLFLYRMADISSGRFKEKYSLVTGIILGLLCLVRENSIILVLVMLAVVWYSFSMGRVTRRKAVNCFLKLLLGLGLVIAPVTLRNYHKTGDFILITSKYGETFYEGNNPSADGTYSPPEFVRSDPAYEHEDFTRKAEELAGRELKPSQVSNFWLKESIKFIVKEPGSWLGIMAKKARYLFNTYEGPDNYDYLFVKKVSTVMRLPFLTFGIIGPLGLVGMLVAFKRRQGLSPLYIFIILYTFSLLAFFIFSRFRMYMVPALSVFAGYGIVYIAGNALAGRLGKVVFPVAVLAFSLLIFHLPVKEQSFVGSYNSLGCVYLDQGKHSEAREAFNKAIALDDSRPEIWVNLGESCRNQAMDAELQPGKEAESRELYGKAFRFKGVGYFNLNRFEAALKEFKRALLYEPDNSDTISYTGIALYYLGRYAEAQEFLERSLELNPGLNENRKALAMIYESNNPGKAIAMWKLYLKEVPDSPESNEEKTLIAEKLRGLSNK